MSRIGKKPVPITSGVKIALQDHLLKFEGPKGKLQLQVHSAIDVKMDNDKKVAGWTSTVTGLPGSRDAQRRSFTNPRRNLNG